MDFARANAYGNVIDNITDTIKWGVERNDKLALQDEEKRRYETQQQRVAESDGRERTKFQNDQADREKKEEAAFLAAMILAGKENKVEEFLTVPENKIIAGTLSKRLLGEAQGDIDSVMRKSASGAFVTSFIKTQMADPAAAEMIKNPNGQPIVFNRANAPEVVFEKLSDSIHGFKSDRKEIDYPDGGKGVYVRDANGNPVINDIRLLPGGKISYTYTIEKTNPDGTKQTLLAPPTEGRDVSDNARVVFRDLSELNDRAMKQSLGGLLTAFTHRHNQLAAEHTKKQLDKKEKAAISQKILEATGKPLTPEQETDSGILKALAENGIDPTSIGELAIKSRDKAKKSVDDATDSAAAYGMAKAVYAKDPALQKVFSDPTITPARGMKLVEEVRKIRKDESDASFKQKQLDIQRARANRSGSGSNKNDQSTKKDIAVRLRDAQRGYQAALKTGDPDAVNESIDMIETHNDAAIEAGVKPLPVPPRPFSTAENDAIKAQAVKNLEDQRRGVSKFFGIKPNHVAITQEMRRIKQTVKPGKVFQQQTQPTGASSAMPPANQHSGRIIRDTETGKRYRSSGSTWLEVR